MSLNAADVHRDASASDPLIYRRQDYVGVLRRLLICVVDFVVIMMIVIPVAMLALVLGESRPDLSELLIAIVMLVVSYCYLTVLRPSRFRSPGYWIAGARIVTIDGRRPTLFRMTLRLGWMALWLFAWPIIVLDFWWTTIDDERQTLRDLFSQTRLIRNNAKPIGTGTASLVFYTGYGLALLYTRVRFKEFLSADSSAERTTVIAAPDALPARHVAWLEDGSRELAIVQCPECRMRVVLNANGHCPSCQKDVSCVP